MTRPHAVMVLNAKGGCGKTTLATNLASYYARQGLFTTLMDYDPQGSSMRWHRLRGNSLPAIHSIAAFKGPVAGTTRVWQLSAPPDTQRLVVDAPAGVQQFQLQDFVRRTDTILIPVLPSSIDIYAASDFIRDLLLVGKARSFGTRLGVVANRANPRTRAYHALQRFLHTLSIPFLTTLRDTQNYVRAAERGVGIHDLGDRAAARDVEQWEPLVEWLESEATVPVKHREGDSAA